jgi:hypothetical protein
MNEVSKRFEQLVSAAQKKLADRDQLIPEKIDRGILVGDVLIVNRGTIKDLWRGDELIYSNISLNVVAIKLANLLALRRGYEYIDRIYNADQDYGKWFTDWQMMKEQHKSALRSGNYERADMLQARYEDARVRAETAKRIALSLANP